MRASRRNRLFVVAVLLMASPRVLSADESLYASLGGMAGIERIARKAFQHFRADPRLHDDFDNINPDYLRPRMMAFLCRLADGPCPYKGRALGASHAGLGIDRTRFEAFIEDYRSAMDELSIRPPIQDRLLERLSSLHRDIVTR